MPTITGQPAHQCGQSRIRCRVGPSDHLVFEVARDRPRRGDRLDGQRAKLEKPKTESRQARRGDGVRVQARTQANGGGENPAENARLEPRVGTHVAQEVDHRRADP